MNNVFWATPTFDTGRGKKALLSYKKAHGIAHGEGGGGGGSRSGGKVARVRTNFL